MAAPLATGLEQQRDVKHDDRGAAAIRLGEKPPFRTRDERVEDRLEPSKGRPIGKHAATQPAAIDAARFGTDIGKGRGDGPGRGTVWFEEPMHHPIGIEQRQAKCTEHRGGGAFAHSDRTGQPKHDHCCRTRVARTTARSSGLTRTGVPNQASKPGRP